MVWCGVDFHEFAFRQWYNYEHCSPRWGAALNHTPTSSDTAVFYTPFVDPCCVLFRPTSCRPGTRSLSKALNTTNNSDLVSFLSQCFTWDPDKRLTPELAMNHPWMQHAQKVTTTEYPTHSTPHSVASGSVSPRSARLDSSAWRKGLVLSNGRSGGGGIGTDTAGSSCGDVRSSLPPL